MSRVTRDDPPRRVKAHACKVFVRPVRAPSPARPRSDGPVREQVATHRTESGEPRPDAERRGGDEPGDRDRSQAISDGRFRPEPRPGHEARPMRPGFYRRGARTEEQRQMDASLPRARCDDQKSGHDRVVMCSPDQREQDQRVHRREHERLAGSRPGPGPTSRRRSRSSPRRKSRAAKPTTVQSSWCCEIQSSAVEEEEDAVGRVYYPERIDG